jgi:3-methyl-2-oxobutanoate hydroxymethyltransferase
MAVAPAAVTPLPSSQAFRIGPEGFFVWEAAMTEKITVPSILRMKQRGEKISCLTAYDYAFARILDEAGVEMLLVGDSLGCVVQGNHNTLAVSMDDMVYHTRLVARGRKRALLIADMPFLSYQTSKEKALENAGRFLKEGGAEAVKLEGGVKVKDTLEAIVNAGIPVMGHVGLTPQSVHRFGGYKIQGRTEEHREMVLRDALAAEEAGAFAVVLEGIPLGLAGEITSRLTVPTIGIGAGSRCDGQVLVLHDMLGLYDDFSPKFVKHYADLKNVVLGAVQSFIGEVKDGKFPGLEHSFK